MYATPCDLLVATFGIAITVVGVQAVDDVLPSVVRDEAALRILAQVIDEQAKIPDRRTTITVEALEWLELCYAVTSASDELLRDGWWQQAQAIARDYTDHAGRVALLPPLERAAMRWNPAQFAGEHRLPLSPLNDMIEVLADPSSFPRAVDELELDITRAKVRVALERFRLAHGRYPSSLDELAPRILSLLPTDPFAPDGAIRYAAHQTNLNGIGRFSVYSVGLDGVDDGGFMPPAATTSDALRGRCSPCDALLVTPTDREN